jgi:hypothetical protein
VQLRTIEIIQLKLPELLVRLDAEKSSVILRPRSGGISVTIGSIADGNEHELFFSNEGVLENIDHITLESRGSYHKRTKVSLGDFPLPKAGFVPVQMSRLEQFRAALAKMWQKLSH